MAIQAGKKAPDFSLPDDKGVLRSLSDYAGRPLVLYFYPKDDTPGWTIEARGFRDDYKAFTAAGVEIVGVSADTPESHRKFKEKYDLPFTLLADTEKQMIQAYGAWGEKRGRGGVSMGILRTTFLIDEEGVVIRVFEKVRSDGHSQEVLEALNAGHWYCWAQVQIESKRGFGLSGYLFPWQNPKN
jgi:peroxiredoxin Q/BCP